MSAQEEGAVAAGKLPPKAAFKKRQAQDQQLTKPAPARRPSTADPKQGRLITEIERGAGSDDSEDELLRDAKQVRGGVRRLTALPAPAAAARRRPSVTLTGAGLQARLPPPQESIPATYRPCKPRVGPQYQAVLPPPPQQPRLQPAQQQQQQQ